MSAVREGDQDRSIQIVSVNGCCCRETRIGAFRSWSVNDYCWRETRIGAFRLWSVNCCC